MKFNKIINMFLILVFLLIPKIVYAMGYYNSFIMIRSLAVMIFSTIASYIVLNKLLSMISNDNSKRFLKILFFLRIGLLLLICFFVTPNIVSLDLKAMIILLFVVTIFKASKKVKISSYVNPVSQILKCKKCNFVLQNTDKFCTNCGTSVNDNSVASNANTPVETVKIASPIDFDSMYRLSEEKMLEEFLNRELLKANVDKKNNLIPTDVVKRKSILNIIFAILLFVYICLIFFHFPILTYIIGIVILFIFYKVTRKYDLISYLKKQLKSRPGEKITNIVMSVKNTLVEDKTNKLFFVYLLGAIILPLIIFSTPKIIYEKTKGGYAVRFYILGVTNFKTATIPSTYKNQPIVSLRGNTFSNMIFLEKVILPDSIIEIRGQAFKNCLKLTEVNMPKNLQYLGGGAFSGAKSIKTVELPDTLTYLGGEAFYKASSLENIKLSNNLTEIKGNTFESCKSLESITIPDKVTRIGARAFYYAKSLSSVNISENSQLKEIGSSAFRMCNSLKNITIPSRTSVNSRAFKESPTKVSYYK